MTSPRKKRRSEIEKCPPSQLYLLFVSCRWDDAIALIKETPEEAQELLYTGQRGAAKISALHVVLAHAKCRGDVPLELVRVLVQVAPNIVMHRHSYTGNLPLHAVFYNPFFSANKRLEIASLLININRASAFEKNQDGRTPLHTICSQHCNYGPLMLMINVAPETTSWVDRNGDLPIHLACRSLKSPNKSIIELYNAHPAGLFHRNTAGLTPLCTVQQAQAERFTSNTDTFETTSINKRCYKIIELLIKLQKSSGLAPCEYEASNDVVVIKRKRVSDGTQSKLMTNDSQGQPTTTKIHDIDEDNLEGKKESSTSPTTVLCELQETTTKENTLSSNVNQMEFTKLTGFTDVDVSHMLLSLRNKGNQRMSGSNDPYTVKEMPSLVPCKAPNNNEDENFEITFKSLTDIDASDDGKINEKAEMKSKDSCCFFILYTFDKGGRSFTRPFMD